MARRAWLLVEWVDEKNVFPSYGVVNIDTFAYKDSDLSPGKEILMSVKFNQPKRAKIIRISDNKQNLQEHKVFLEQQDKQVKNVLQLCMQTIKEMKSERFPSNAETESRDKRESPQQVITAFSDNSASENDSEVPTVRRYKNKQRSNKSRISYPQQQSSQANNNKKRLSVPAISQRNRSVITSTPLPECRMKNVTKLVFDQGTQTDADDAFLSPAESLEKIEEMESVLKHLYEQFQNLVAHANIYADASLDASEADRTGDVSQFDSTANETWVDENNVNGEEIVTGGDDKCIESSIINESAQNVKDIKTYVKNENVRPESASRVRRMSAQTTNSLDMVPIGDGHAMVPARLLNEIDWNTYTTATRQLLQAIFSRKVLATHSLTGKPSPAHLNKPAKKVLDPKLINDIVMTVSSRCGVANNLVRNCITIKCTDEAKLYRNRQRHLEARTEKNRQNNENIPPTQTHSFEETNVIS